ncbi:MAG: hypothetical protein WDN69_31655 [Aliidongia sp.]
MATPVEGVAVTEAAAPRLTVATAKALEPPGRGQMEDAVIARRRGERHDRRAPGSHWRGTASCSHQA